jgi:hypothetical protein
MVEPCVLLEWETSNVYRGRLTQIYEYTIQDGDVSVKEIHHFHHIELRCPDEFYLEFKSKEAIKNLTSVQKI